MPVPRLDTPVCRLDKVSTPAVCRLPDELFSAILRINKRRAITERLEAIMARTTTYPMTMSTGVTMHHIINGDHRRSIGFRDNRLQCEIVMFRQMDDMPVLTFFVYALHRGARVKYVMEQHAGNPL